MHTLKTRLFLSIINTSVHHSVEHIISRSWHLLPEHMSDHHNRSGPIFESWPLNNRNPSPLLFVCFDLFVIFWPGHFLFLYVMASFKRMGRVWDTQISLPVGHSFYKNRVILWQTVLFFYLYVMASIRMGRFCDTQISRACFVTLCTANTSLPSTLMVSMPYPLPREAVRKNKTFNKRFIWHLSINSNIL